MRVYNEESERGIRKHTPSGRTSQSLSRASRLSVVIDNSQRVFAQNTTAKDIMRKFIQPLPATSARLSERTTATKKPVTSPEYRCKLLVELEKDTSVVYKQSLIRRGCFWASGVLAVVHTAQMGIRSFESSSRSLRRKDTSQGSRVKLEPSQYPRKTAFRTREACSSIVNVISLFNLGNLKIRAIETNF
jgi:hypothetical protein